MTCKHLINGTCDLANQLAAQPVTPHESACRFCTESADPPQSVNRVTVSIAVSSLPHDSPRRAELLQTYGHLLHVQSTPPTWAQQAWSVARAVADLAADGGRLLDAETYQGRLAICDACPNRDGHRCRICGCFVRAKARLPQEQCPMQPPLWTRVEASAASPPAAAAKPKQKLILKTKLCPGDLLTLTAAVESLHATYPGEYAVDVRTNHPAIWQANPWITRLADDDPNARHIDCHYPSVHRCNQESVPFLAGYTEHLAGELGRPLRLRTNRPHLYLSPNELSRPLWSLWQGAPDLQALSAGRPIWLVVAGVKSDYTIKGWPVEHFQAVVDATADRICWVQIGLRQHQHPPLSNVVSLLDTGPPMRDLIVLAHRAAGGLGPVTFLQHLMAAWQKPYVCLVGGREPATWVQYPLQHTLHTVGQFDCCRLKSCWKARVVPLNDGDDKDKNLCLHPVTEDLQRPAAQCMAMITPAEVLAILERHACT